MNDYKKLLAAPMAVGHTTASASAAADVQGALIVATQAQAVNVLCRFPSLKRAISLGNLGRLEGEMRPIVVDLAAVQVIIRDYEDRIEELKATLIEREAELDEAQKQRAALKERGLSRAREWILESIRQAFHDMSDDMEDL